MDVKKLAKQRMDRGRRVPNARRRREFRVVYTDLCTHGFHDTDSGLPHKTPTGLGTNSPGIKEKISLVCSDDHEHQPLERREADSAGIAWTKLLRSKCSNNSRCGSSSSSSDSTLADCTGFIYMFAALGSDYVRLVQRC